MAMSARSNQYRSCSALIKLPVDILGRWVVVWLYVEATTRMLIYRR